MKSLPRALRLLARLSAAAAVTALVACSDSPGSGTPSGEGGGGGAGCKTGANAPFATPAGTPFALPAGVTLEGGEATGDLSGVCEQRSSSLIEYGGDLLPVCLSLVNGTDADITFTLPAGLFFLSKAADGQNGIMLHDHVITVPAKDTLYVRINLFCANKHCYFGRATDRYTFGNVTNDPKLLELIALAAKVNLGDAVDGDNDSRSDAAYAFGQGVWEITEGGTLSDETRALIADLPPRS